MVRISSKSWWIGNTNEFLKADCKILGLKLLNPPIWRVFLLPQCKQSQIGPTEAKINYIGFDSQSISIEPSDEVLIKLLIQEINALDEVIVSGFQSGIVKSLNKQRNDANITNVVSSDQVGKFPAANIRRCFKKS